MARMKNTRYHLGVVLPIAWLMSFPAQLAAQVFMRPFDNAANLALGGAALARPDVATGWVNPAQLGQNLPKIGAQAWSVLPYSITGWQSHGGQVGLRIDPRSGAGLTVWHSGIEGYREQRAEFAYGRRLGPKWTLGGSASVMHVSADEYGQRTTGTVSVGVQAQALPRLWIAGLITNPAVQRFEGYALPTVVQLSAAWVTSDKVLIITEIDKNLNAPTRLKAGIEYRPTDKLSLRVGTRSHPSRLSLGAGIRWQNGIALDFGSEWHPVLGITPGMMVRYAR
jgi:hypothetical protein